MKQSKKRVFVRLEQGIDNARAQAEKQKAHQEAQPQEPVVGQNPANAPPQNVQGMGYVPYMQPMYMPYMPYMQVLPPPPGGNPPQQQVQPSAPQSHSQPSQQPQPLVQAMPGMPGMPLLTCIPNAQGQPQWVQVMPMPPQSGAQQPFVQPVQPFVQPQYMQPPFVPQQPYSVQPQAPPQQSSVQQPTHPPQQQEPPTEPQAQDMEPPQERQAEPVKAQEPPEESVQTTPQAEPPDESAQTTPQAEPPEESVQVPQAEPTDESVQAPQPEPPAASANEPPAAEASPAQPNAAAKPPPECVQEQPSAQSEFLETAEQKAEAIKRAAEASATLADAPFTRRKNRMKQGRVVFEIVLLAAMAWILMELFFTLKTYEPFAAAAVSEEDHGFIALSYFGVDRNGETSTLIGKEQLRLHLAELKEQGYVTISQQDVLDYYQNGKPLPPRSLFLMFEDGRRDTAIFAQEIMEDLNLKATMMTYPEKFIKEDTKFLSPKDLKELESSTYWEMGSNGYRLAYINVFDRYGDFLGELDPLRFNLVSRYLDRRYNHYLMDYIRDKDGIPTESERQMERRVTYDYTRLRDVYEEELGYVPRAHVLMHANTGRFGNNPRVSAVNERWIRDIFPMNFNREGFVLNKRTSSLYDLTRMQPQPYWPINHLLMRINYDTDGSLSFVEGRAEGRRAWDLKEGALECKEETLILTTLPEGKAVARLADVEDLRDLRFEAELEGNAFGSQQIFLRSSVDLAEAVGIVLVNDQLVVEEIKGGEKHELYREKLPVILGEKILSVEEAHQEAKVGENEAFALYATSPAAANEYMGRANEEREAYAATVEDGAAPYEGRASFHRRGKCKLTIHLKDDRLSVEVDGHIGPEDILLSRTESGSVFLGSSWQGEAWSQRNLADDVYDGVFKKVRVLTETGKTSDEEQLLYSSEYTGMEKVQHRVKEIWESVLRWFLDYV